MLYIASDEILKENIQVIDPADALNRVMMLRGYTYNRASNGREDIGVLAQEVEAVAPELVKTFNTEEYGMIKAVEYPNLAALLVQAVHRLHDLMLDAGEERLADQRSDIEELSWRVQALENGKKWDGTPGDPIDWGDGGGG